MEIHLGRRTRDSNLETRTARLRLSPRSEPYWRGLETGFALGYRRGTRGGTWLARRTKEKGYEEHRIGIADDSQDPDGVAVLSYSQALAAARNWWVSQRRFDEGYELSNSGSYTVAQAISDYMAAYERRGGKAAKATWSAANTHILPLLGNIPITKLTTRRIRDWHAHIAAAPARVRTKPGMPPNMKAFVGHPDEVRKRRATANRILTILKAALNFSWKEGHVTSDETWRKVRPFREVEVPVFRYLTREECVRLVNACHGPFRDLVRGALLTGCRYGELSVMRVADFNAEAGIVTVRASKSGKARHVVLTEEGQRLFSQLTLGQASDLFIFKRSDGRPWDKSQQLRPMLDACRRAGITPPVSFHILRHTYGSQLAMQGAPMRVIAEQLGHADTRMTERHYAHLAPSYVADTIRASFPDLGIATPASATVIPLKVG